MLNGVLQDIEALRRDAEQPKHPGYIIGSHWLETAYSRICAGEAEADVLRDIGLVRITDGMVETADINTIVDRQEALRRENEQLRKALLRLVEACTNEGVRCMDNLLASARAALRREET